MTSVDDTKKQDILIVHNYYQIPGGEDTVVANEKKMLEKRGHKVILYSRNNDEVNTLLKHAKALIMCSQWYETFGMVIAEAYSCGTPVIVGNIGNIKDLVIPGKTGEVFEYNSQQDMIAAIKRFEDKPYREYSRNAYALFNEGLTSESNYNLLMNIYDKLT